MPNSPETVEEVESAFAIEATMNAYGFTVGEPKRQFYRGTVVKPSFAFTVFASPVVLDYITAANENLHYHVDGTFSIVPRGEFKQLLVIHLAHQSHVS